MSDKRLFDIWAWSQIEAAADGSLDRESLERMREAEERDARLRAAIVRARALRGALRASGRESAPRGLLGSLLAIPQRHPRVRKPVARGTASGPVWATAGGAAAAAALAAVVVAGLSGPPLPPPGATTATPEPLAPALTEQELAAAREFAVALAYLNKSAAITGREVGVALNDGFTAALAVSRNSLSRRPE